MIASFEADNNYGKFLLNKVERLNYKEVNVIKVKIDITYERN